MRLRSVALATLVLLALAVGWLALRDASPTLHESASPVPTVTMVSETPGADEGSGVGLPAEHRTPPRTEGRADGPDPADAERLRRAILESVAASERRGRGDPTRRDGTEDEPEFGPGNLEDRIGGREALTTAINHEFIPLADECIAAARERSPGLEGMLAIELSVAGDPELGSVVETVTFGDRNEVLEPELLECVENTALSTFLPPPPDGISQESFMLTLPIEPEPDAS